MLVFFIFSTVGEDEEWVGGWKRLKTVREGGRERHGGVRWGDRGEGTCLSACFLVQTRKPAEEEDIDQKREEGGGNGWRRVFVGGQEEDLWEETGERWPHIAGGRHSLLCNDYNVFASSTITTIVQKATKPNCQAETCNHCAGQKAMAAI